jgi:anion-transporting  ArsA/GET3 family ATPase
MSFAAFDRRLLILSGKGGVGKSTVALALGLRAAEQGLETLICEMGENEKIAPLFGRAASSFRETPLGIPRLSSIYLDPQEAFNDYVRASLKLAALARPLIESRMIRAFVQAAPGLKEIMTLTKLMEFERLQDRKGKPKYDLIILDAPATGHGLSLFRSPMLAMRATKVGPMYQKAKLISDLLSDAARTRMHIVTLAEEMPVAETLEMIAAIRSDLHIPLGEIVVNGVAPPAFQGSSLALLSELQNTPAISGSGCWGAVPAKAVMSVAAHMDGRATLNEQYLKHLQQRTDLPLITLPFIFDVPWNLSSVHKLAAKLR